jgi:hypothetical protein
MSGQSIKTLDQRTQSLSAAQSPVSSAGINPALGQIVGTVLSGSPSTGYNVAPIGANRSVTPVTFRRVLPIIGGLTFEAGDQVVLQFDAGDNTYSILSGVGGSGGGGSGDEFPVVTAQLRFFTGGS